MVALPLAVITVFCFSYLMINAPQSDQKLNNYETAAASKKPRLLTGKPLAPLKPAKLKAEPEIQPIADSTLGLSTESATAQASGLDYHAPATANPQSASPAGATYYSGSNKAADLPLLKVVVPKPLTNLLGHR